MSDITAPFTLACATFDITSHESVASVTAILEPITANLAQSKAQRYRSRTHIIASDAALGSDWVRMMSCGQIYENFGATLAEPS
jgi:hypothetical protein